MEEWVVPIRKRKSYMEFIETLIMKLWNFMGYLHAPVRSIRIWSSMCAQHKNEALVVARRKCILQVRQVILKLFQRYIFLVLKVIVLEDIFKQIIDVLLIKLSTWRGQSKRSLSPFQYPKSYNIVILNTDASFSITLKKRNCSIS